MSLGGLMMYQDQALHKKNKLEVVRDPFCACRYVFCVFVLYRHFSVSPFLNLGQF